MNTYIAVHNHEYGASAYLFRASEIPDDALLAKNLNLDFEPDRGESIDVCPVDLDDIVTVGPDARELLTQARSMLRDLSLNAGTATVRELPEHPRTFVDRLTAFIGDAYDFETGEHSDGAALDGDAQTVRMVSDEFGAEDFHYDSMADALAGIVRLVRSARDTADGIERMIGIVVNPADDRDARTAPLDGGPAARSLALIFRVDVPADCPLDDAGIVRALNDCLAVGMADASETADDPDCDCPEAEALAGIDVGRINAILTDAGLRDTAARFRDASRYSPDTLTDADDIRDAVTLADAFLGLGIV